jgi:hypothetical protein
MKNLLAWNAKPSALGLLSKKMILLKIKIGVPIHCCASGYWHAFSRLSPMITTEEDKAKSQAFYKEALELLDQTGVPYMLGGAFSVFHHTGLFRDTKDLDVFLNP